MYIRDLADQIDNLEMVDGRYDLTINVFLRALVIKEAPKCSYAKYIAELDESSGWASSRPTTRATDLMVDDLAEFAFVDDDDDSPLTTDQDRGVEMGEGALRGRARARISTFCHTLGTALRYSPSLGIHPRGVERFAPSAARSTVRRRVPVFT